MARSVTTHKVRSQPSWLSVLRILLGIILVWKGVNFIRDTTVVASMIEQTGIGVFSRSSAAIAWIVSLLSIVCGIFITVGFFTRISSIIMIPIVFVAVVFIQMKNIERNSFELILTIIVLVLLILFAIKGSGPLSADEYFRRGDVIDRDI
jgi:putative oxidoreductase